MRIRVENAYSDGHELTLEYDVDDARVATEELEDVLFEFTGDGHGIDSSLGCYHKVTVLDGEHAGKTFEWDG